MTLRRRTLQQAISLSPTAPEMVPIINGTISLLKDPNGKPVAVARPGLNVVTLAPVPDLIEAARP